MPDPGKDTEKIASRLRSTAATALHVASKWVDRTGLTVGHDMIRGMSTSVVSLQARRMYSFSQIDHVLGLYPGTASRWIDGYERGNKFYPPVVREERSGDPVATWGELVECRFLSEYRHAGVSIQRLRPAVEQLRELTGSVYPLASARLWIAADGRELVAAVQESVKLDRALSLVVVRSGQGILWSDRALAFQSAVKWSNESEDAEAVGLIVDSSNPGVEIDPLRGYGDPVISGRNVTTETIRELVQSGEPLESIADSYELSLDQIASAVRYELGRTG